MFKEGDKVVVISEDKWKGYVCRVVAVGVTTSGMTYVSLDTLFDPHGNQRHLPLSGYAHELALYVETPESDEDLL